MSKLQIANRKSSFDHSSIRKFVDSQIRHSLFAICYLLFAICLLCAVAIAPLLRSVSPCTHDGALHYFRVVAMRHALQDGVLFTRYLPDLAFGYGYPFFNYREPLPYCLALVLYLTGLALPVALNLVYVLSSVCSALTAYLLARDLFGPQAGLVAAVAYAYAPYQFLDALLRANMPESVALPLLPLILWAFRRLALTGRRRWFLASVASLAALYLTHNISSLLFTPFLLAYLAVLWLAYRRQGHWIAVGIALALAFGVTAFFWGPALMEQGYVQLHMSRVTRNNDFHYNFVSLAEIFAPPAPVDASLMNPPMRIHLGLVQVVLGVVGLVAGLIRWRDRERRATLTFFALTAVVMIWMSTRTSLWLWERVPFLAFVQFPWRLVGRAALPVAILAGAGLPYATRNTQHATRGPYFVLRVAYYVIVGLLILSAFPSTYPPRGYCSNAAHPTITDVFTYEHRSKLVGVDPEGSYFPIWVKRRPSGSPLEEQYTAGGPVARFDEAVLPAGASVIEADYGPNRARIVVETPVSFRARYLAFYFPGWRVTVDGEPIPISPTDPDGLISFDVPAGRHTVAVRFGSTPIRTAFTIISFFSLIALAFAICYLLFAIRHSPFAHSPIRRFVDSQIRYSPFSICYLLFAIFLLAFKLAVVDRTDTIFRHPTLQPDGTLPGVEHPLDRFYADGLTLIGYDQERTTIPADGTLRLDLYWTARARPAAPYQTVIHLVGPAGLRWSKPDSFRPRGYADYPPTTTWGPDRYALDSHEVEPVPGTPPGTYDVVLTVFDRDTLAPLSVLNDQGQPAAPDLMLGSVTLTRPIQPVALPMSGRLDLPLGDFTLLTADFDRAQAVPGDSVYLTLMWHAEKDSSGVSSSRHMTLSLLAPDSSQAANYPVSPAAETWLAGDVLRSQHRLILPAMLATNTYTWSVGRSASSHYAIAQLSVVAPPHMFTPPPVDVEANARLDNVATLLGANLEPVASDLKPGTSLTVTLIWRAEATASDSYHVFLHLLNPDGLLVSQSDGIPAGWSRPTTGWLSDEYITDDRVLTIPPDARAGDYTLQVGLYLPGIKRLSTPDGADAIRLATITVKQE